MTSAWERDDSPALDCTVCGAPADRRIEFPPVPDVHIAFGIAALCSACDSLATAGDSAALTKRAVVRWGDEPDTLDDLTRLVLASAGHVLEPNQPRPHRKQPSPAPLTGSDLAVWRQLEPLMYGETGLELTVHGRIVSESDEATITIVHRAGRRYRLADGDGRVRMTSDGATAWSRYGDDTVAMVAAAYAEPGGGPPELALAFHRRRIDAELFGFGTPIGPIVADRYLGRPAWRFAFAAPPRKPADMHVVVDAETGLTLEKRFGDWSLSRWTEFETGVSIEPALFTWTGPTIDLAAVRVDQEREHREDMAQRSAWFAEHITPNPLVLAGEPVEVMLHEWDADGSFQATLDGTSDGSGASLARRPRSGARWRLGWQDVTNRWSDDQWDWALQAWNDDGTTVGLTEPALAELRAQFGS